MAVVVMTRSRRTSAEVEQLREQIIEVLEMDNPQSVRHVYYRMTDPRLPYPVPKTDKGYVMVQRECVKLRREGLIPYGYITDSTRRGYFAETYGCVSEAVTRTARFYRRNLWDSQDHYVEVWCESRSIAGVIQDACEKWQVPLYPCGGFASLSLVHSAAEYMDAVVGERDIVIIYIGDYDPAGLLIDQKVLEELAGHLPYHEIGFNRVAITEEQIDLMVLPTKPRTDTSRRRLDIQETVEAEAMPAATLRELLSDEIEGYIDPHELSVIQVAEESERMLLTRLAEQVREAT